MVVNKVALTADAMMTCLVHALSTEREEIMGLLVGELTGDHEEVCEITNLLIIKRVDKRKDRSVPVDCGLFNHSAAQPAACVRGCPCPRAANFRHGGYFGRRGPSALFMPGGACCLCTAPLLTMHPPHRPLACLRRGHGY